MNDFILMYGQPGTGIRETGPTKRNKSFRFIRDLKTYDLYYGSITALPAWVAMPSHFWAYDMGGFYALPEIRKALSTVDVPHLILSYVPYNAKKAHETAHTAAADNASFVLVYAREDKAKFLLATKEYTHGIGLCDDHHENCRYVVEAGFRAVHCTVGTNIDFKEEDTAKTKRYEGIELAETVEELLSHLA